MLTHRSGVAWGEGVQSSLGSDTLNGSVSYLVRGLLSHVLASFLCDGFLLESRRTGRQYHLLDFLISGISKRKCTFAGSRQDGVVWLTTSHAWGVYPGGTGVSLPCLLVCW